MRERGEIKSNSELDERERRVWGKRLMREKAIRRMDERECNNENDEN